MGTSNANSIPNGVASGSWDPDEYMQSYDSDDYDDATYFQLHSLRVTAQRQSPRMLFDTAADRQEKQVKQRRKVKVAIIAHFDDCLQ